MITTHTHYLCDNCFRMLTHTHTDDMSKEVGTICKTYTCPTCDYWLDVLIDAKTSLPIAYATSKDEPKNTVISPDE